MSLWLCLRFSQLPLQCLSRSEEQPVVVLSKQRVLRANDSAASLGIRIYTIGIGADQMTLPGLFGSSFGSRQVNPSAELDEATLQKIADLTGGQYFRARNPQELANIYQVLDELEPVEQEVVTYRPRQALGYLPLLLALLVSFGLALRHLVSAGNWRRTTVPGETR